MSLVFSVLYTSLPVGATFLVLFSLSFSHLSLPVRERPNVGGVSNRSRNGALSRKGCVFNGQMTTGQATNEYPPLNMPPPVCRKPELLLLSVCGADLQRRGHRVLAVRHRASGFAGRERPARLQGRCVSLITWHMCCFPCSFLFVGFWLKMRRAWRLSLEVVPCIQWYRAPDKNQGCQNSRSTFTGK